MIDALEHLHKHKVRVYLEDTDGFGLVYHANYIKYFERGRIEWLLSRGISLNTLREQGIALVVRQMQVDYKKSAYLEDELIIQTKLVSMKLSLANFEQAIYSQSQVLIATLKIKVMALDQYQKPCMMANIV